MIGPMTIITEEGAFSALSTYSPGYGDAPDWFTIEVHRLNAMGELEALMLEVGAETLADALGEAVTSLVVKLDSAVR